MTHIAAVGETLLPQVEQALLERWPETKVDPTLERIALLLSLLGQPQTRYSTVHVTGTNGKTSTARMVEGLLQASGSRTGRLTSPHLTSMRERISLGGQPIDAGGFLAAYTAVAEYAKRVDAVSTYALSFFEMMVAMAYHAFAEHGIDAAVVEVGMGGRWDATNVIDADVATVLPISLDHADYLGSTTSAIAHEKAGIIKPGTLAVTARQEPPVETVLREHAEMVGAHLMVEDRDFAVISRGRGEVGQPGETGQIVTVRGIAGVYEDVPLALSGPHQAQNAAVAIASAEALQGGPLDVDVVRSALGNASSPGRFQVIAGSPPLILDAAHNPHGAAALVESLVELGPGRTVAVVAVMGDKDHRTLLRHLGSAVDEIVCTRNSSPRCLPAAELAATATEVLGTGRVHVAADLTTALATARSLTTGMGCIITGAERVLITGSVVTVGDAMRLLTVDAPT